MTIDGKLLEVLACPACRGQVAVTEQQTLECAGCGRIYPIRDGIPVLMVEEATPPTRPDDSSGT